MSGRELSALRLALLGQRLWEEEGALRTAEPIAIVGMACRIPGAEDPDALWRLLLEGRDEIREVPPDRWSADWYDPDPARPGRTSTNWGGFLDDIRGFDAAYFGIPAREAERMDPQQRIALEVTYEAIERAGIPLAALRGTAAGVFFASYHNDYALLQYADPDGVTARTLTGTLHSVVSNRISHLLGVHGPSLAVDSACSSSLVATHLACQSLRSRDCDVAIAGGVSIMAVPHVTIALSRGGFMSPTGHCHTFSDRADGFVRAEGCGAVVLKRLADAVRDGDPVLAVIRGSAVNQDGESTTLSAPNGIAQAAVVRVALRNAGLSPERVSLIEAHGTGTELGDPIETDALAGVFAGRAAEDVPCWLGSLKANVGHLEAAAGVAGLIKAVLCIRHGVVPPHPLLDRVNPHITLDGTPFRIARAAEPWDVGGPRIAGVSSFGVGGTNAHVVVEQSPLGPVAAESADDPPWVLPFSAKNPRSFARLASEHARRVRSTSDIAAYCRAAARSRSHHRDYRGAVVGGTAVELADALDAIARREAPARNREAPALGFIYAGQGTQWAGMGVALAAAEPTFLASLERIDERFRALGGIAPLELLRSGDAAQLERTDVAQTTIFAIQVALTELLRRWGIEPSVVVGHSIGELAAATAAGLLDEESAVRAVALRASAMQSAPEGRMIAVRMSPADARSLIDQHGLRLAIAAVNAPSATVLSGETATVERAAELLAAAGLQHRLLDVRYAFHSPAMREAAGELRAAAASIANGKSDRTRFISTVTGDFLAELDADYLARNVESTVRFADALGRAVEEGVRHFIEIGPHPALGAAIAEIAEAAGHGASVGFAMHRKRSPLLALRSLAADLHAWGADLDWTAVMRGHVDPSALPTYPWHHQPYWLPGVGVPTPGGASKGELHLEDAAFDGMREHRIGGTPLLPATAIIELFRMSRRVSSSLPDASHVIVRDLVIERPVPLEGDVRLRVVSNAADATVELRVISDGAALRAASARVTTEATWPAPFSIEPPSAPARDAAAFHADLRARGCDFGPGFRLLRRIAADANRAEGWLDAGAAASWRQPNGEGGDAPVTPAVLDACGQLCIAILDADAGAELPELRLPWSVDAVRVRGGGTPQRAVARRVERAGDGSSFDIALYDDAGAEIARIDGWHVRAAAPAATRVRTREWRRESPEPAPAEAAQAWTVAGAAGGIAGSVVARLHERGVHARLLGDVEEVSDRLIWCGALEPASADAVPAAETACTALLSFVERLRGADRVRRLIVPTLGAQTVGVTAAAATRGETEAVIGGAVLGLVRAIRAEQPELRCTALDLEPAASDDAAVDAIVAEALADADAGEVAVRAGERYVAGEALTGSPAALLRSGPVALRHDEPGTLSGFSLVAADRADPPAGHVRLRVLAASLNFRDVLTALGEVPAQWLGHDCCGVIEAVAPDVDSIRVGEVVVALAGGCFASTVIAPAAHTAPVPAGLDPVAAATLPVAFGTAFFALHECGGIDERSTVLVHAGAGGVGMAAIRLARTAGARVYATAGTPEKRALLLEEGVAGVFDSRSPEFAERVLAETGGRGVDLVLNSLTGPMLRAGFAALAPDGLFVELGKRELLSPTEVAAIRTDVRYRAFDLREEVERDPGLLPRMLAALRAYFEAGRILPLPATVFPLADAASAFRTMARGGHVGRLVLVPPSEGVPIPGEGWAVITGGTGALGRLSLHWLLRRGWRRIALWARTEPTAEVRHEIDTLAREHGADLRLASVDVSDAAAVRSALASLRAAAPIEAVVHAAGVVGDGLIDDISPARLHATMAPKAAGAWNLHDATRGDPVRAFVLFSAAGPLVDATAQGMYAAANGFVDALAARRRGQGMPATAVAWGPWRDDGMAARLDPKHRDRWERKGLAAWTADDADTLLAQVFAAAPCHLMAVRNAAPPSADRPAAADAVRAPAVVSMRAAAQPGDTRKRVHAAIAAVLGAEAAADTDRPLRDAGLDSLGAIEVRNALSTEFGIMLPATLAFDHPTIDAIGAHIAERVGATDVATATEPADAAVPAAVSAPERAVVVAPDAPVVAAHTSDDPVAAPIVTRKPDGPPDGAIAIVGIGLRFPGADSPEAFARLLRNGEDALREIGDERWPHRAFFDSDRTRPGTYYVRRGGFIDGVDRFDPEFFGIAPLEAVWMDPQQRLLLETSWSALEHAGIAPDSLRGSRTGVFTGISTHDYHRLVMSRPDRLNAYGSSGTALSVAAGRLAYVLGLNGPALAIDTACSSSLVAVHLASRSLRAGESDIALAGGVSLMLTPEINIDFCRAGMLSADGRCRTFDAAADGYVRGEGCAIVVLKRLGDARRDGDRVLALLRGTAVNQDGRSSGLTAPSGPAQTAVIRAALADAGLAPADIEYVEAHGTGTPLGDPIELHALGEVFGARWDPNGSGAGRARLRVGSVKTNVGHLEAAAGVAGLIKAVIAVESGEIPPHLHFETPNPHVMWRDLPFEIPREPVRFEDPVRRAGVSSFGFSGTNAHVIIEQAPPPPPRLRRSVEPRLHVLPLSARTAEALRELARAYIAFLRTTEDDFGDICHTAIVGRAKLEYRTAVSAASAAEAADRLERWMETGELPEDGPAREWIDNADPTRLPDAGPHAAYRRVTLPGYPFERRRFWITDSWNDTDAPGAAWEAAVRSADASASVAPIDVNLAAFPERWTAMGRLAHALGRNLLARRGAFDHAGTAASVDDVVRTTGIRPVYTHIVRRWLDRLTDEEVFERDGERYRAAMPLVAIDEAPLRAEVDRVLEGDPPLARYFGHAARLAERVLTGEISPLETLFPDGSFELARELYAGAAPLRYVNGIAAAALREWVRARPGTAPVRLLEIGAGTGGTTGALLPALEGRPFEYAFSDVSDEFLALARERFADADGLYTLRFDIDRDAAEQGIAHGAFDVVIASNAMHASRDLPAALRRARTLLAPHGLLLLVESTSHLDWHDVSTGLIEGWQTFTDDLRTDSPLLDATAWIAALRSAGFDAAEAFPRAESPASVLRQHVLIARAPAVSAESIEPVSAAAPVRAAAVEQPEAVGANGSNGFRQRIAGALERERLPLAIEAVRECVMTVLRADPERPPSSDARLLDLGLDSLMAVRLRHLLERRLGLEDLPSTLAFDQPSIRHIARYALDRIGGGTTADTRAREIATMNDDEVEALLIERLEAEGLG